MAVLARHSILITLLKILIEQNPTLSVLLGNFTVDTATKKVVILLYPSNG